MTLKDVNFYVGWAASARSGAGDRAVRHRTRSQNTPTIRRWSAFSFGGNDANNMVIPYTDYTSYSNARLASGRHSERQPAAGIA